MMLFPRRLLTNPNIRRRWYTPLGSHVAPLVIAREKERLLHGKVKHILKSAPGWNELLASDSEAMIKAEREPDPLSFKDLQNESVRALNSDDDIEIVEHIKKEVKIKTEEDIIAKLRE
ncbi:hypothetical protein RclHR1_07960007 [Rhizophagus clarus]|uniref:Uncharacterized protein n=1 Tax=Rhizophagus clarus TaxID=94130 RepID=A0A2Z6S131_9GLOM|nr:hypothetical protein RclHR1_07960007 [Rhizophagus clarus]GES77951.1 hypothetical protein RCL_jg29461.t1 [Rhizophagus clarus]